MACAGWRVLEHAPTSHACIHACLYKTQTIIDRRLNIGGQRISSLVCPRRWPCLVLGSLIRVRNPIHQRTPNGSRSRHLSIVEHTHSQTPRKSPSRRPEKGVSCKARECSFNLGVLESRRLGCNRRFPLRHLTLRDELRGCSRLQALAEEETC